MSPNDPNVPIVVAWMLSKPEIIGFSIRYSETFDGHVGISMDFSGGFSKRFLFRNPSNPPTYLANPIEVALDATFKDAMHELHGTPRPGQEA